MLNCFEARRWFTAFWKRELQAELRAELTEHLRVCRRCDEAFRAFALTAPVLHSESAPAGARRAGSSGGFQARRPAALARREAGGRRLAASAAAMLLVAASMAAYFAVTAPIGTLSDELSVEAPVSQIFGMDPNSPGDDLAG